MNHFDILSDHIGQWITPHPFYEPEVKDNGLHGICPVAFINLGNLEVICLLFLQLLLVLVCSILLLVTKNFIWLGPPFYFLEHECLELNILCHQ